MAAAVVCLQAQRVTGLPASVHQVDLGCHLHHPHLHVDDAGDEPEGRASARVSGGCVADFQNQVLLLHCAVASSVVVTVSLSLLSDDSLRHRRQQYLELDLGNDQRPGVLSFQLAAGAVLTLALHRKLLPLPPTTTPCLPLPACCRRHRRHRRQGYDSADESSSGFIVIEKQYRRPPSDNLLTTDDDDDYDQDAMKLEIDRVEDEFLAMLELAETADARLDLDMLVRDAEAELLASKAPLLDADDAAAAAAASM